jgi:hypothetical protein
LTCYARQLSEANAVVVVETKDDAGAAGKSLTSSPEAGGGGMTSCFRGTFAELMRDTKPHQSEVAGGKDGRAKVRRLACTLLKLAPFRKSSTMSSKYRWA